MLRFGRHNSRQSQQGFALLLTLIVVLVLSTLVIDLSYSARVAATIAGNQRDSLMANYLAQAGVNISILRLDIDKLIDQTFGKKDDLNELQWSMPFAYPLGLTMLTGQLSQAGISQEMTDKFTKNYDVGGTFQSDVTDESARINLNAVKINGTTPNGSYLILQNLLANKEFKSYFKDRKAQDFMNNLVDWLDEDNISRDLSGGMENDYYQSLRPQFHAKNGPLFTFDEMRLIKDTEGAVLAMLEPYLTVYPYSTSKFLGPDYGKININTADKAVLASIFDRNLVSAPEEIAKKIVEARAKTSFKNKNEFMSLLQNNYGVQQTDINPTVLSLLEVRSDYFRVKSVANVNETEVVIETVIDRSADKPEYYYWKVD